MWFANRSDNDLDILTAPNCQADCVAEVVAREHSTRVPAAPGGRDVGVVRVVSIHSTKGFEFKQVLRAHIDPRPLDADQADPSEIEQERRWRERRDLYVEMTRARHRLGITVRSGATRSR